MVSPLLVLDATVMPKRVGSAKGQYRSFQNIFLVPKNCLWKRRHFHRDLISSSCQRCKHLSIRKKKNTYGNLCKRLVYLVHHIGKTLHRTGFNRSGIFDAHMNKPPKRGEIPFQIGKEIILCWSPLDSIGRMSFCRDWSDGIPFSVDFEKYTLSVISYAALFLCFSCYGSI